MTSRKTIFPLVVCAGIALFGVQSLCQTGPPDRTERLREMERLRNMTEAERERYAEKKRAQARLEQERKQKEDRKTAAKRRLVRERGLKEFQEEVAERREQLLHEKAALGVTEDQWKLIKPKLEKVRDLQGRARSTVVLNLSGSSASGSPGVQGPPMPTWRWNVSWKDKEPNELTEAQKIADRLMALVDRDNTTEAQFRRTMEALRKARCDEVEIQSQLGEARRQLREGLTTRQEAALVLMGWL